MRWCTKPGCKGSMRGDSVDTEQVTCPECNTVVCFKCKDEWHAGITCEANADQKIFGLEGAGGTIKFCPVCRTKIQKNEGCNHMTCLYCKYDFCWFCLGYAGYDVNHWGTGMGCGASQFGEDPRSEPFCKKFWKAIGMGLLGILAVIFGPACVCVANLWKCCISSAECIGCLLALAFTPVAIAIGFCASALIIAFSPFILIGYLWKMCKAKRKAANVEAMARLEATARIKEHLEGNGHISQGLL